MSDKALSAHEKALLRCLLLFYREFGPGAAPALKGLEEEAGMERHELDEAVEALRARELIEYWALQPALRLTAEGLQAAIRLESDPGA